MAGSLFQSDILGPNPNFVVKIHRLITNNVQTLERVFYLPVKMSSNSRLLSLRTKFKSNLVLLFFTILDLGFVIPAIICTPIVVRENAQDISLVLIPSLGWICLWLSIFVYQIPAYVHRENLTSFLNVFMALNISKVFKGKLSSRY